jgi:2-dehydro-3-deoxy-D-arabinonate dehydratase
MHDLKVYKTECGIVVSTADRLFQGLMVDFDVLMNKDQLHNALQRAIQSDHFVEITKEAFSHLKLLPPIGNQEIWAAGVTYKKSREARLDESGNDCYSHVYDADRPELFLKATPIRASGHLGNLNIRRDSTWNVPEPELTLFVNNAGVIAGYCCGNDMSSRDIEGENPLYLPQAKVYDLCAGLGPCVLVPFSPLEPTTQISLNIHRDSSCVFEETTSLAAMKRTLPELAHYLCMETTFPVGVFLMTGTCIVPPNEFTLREGDKVDVTIDRVGTLTNYVTSKKKGGLKCRL